MAHPAAVDQHSSVSALHSSAAVPAALLLSSAAFQLEEPSYQLMPA